jgi:hypothetical protein
MNGRKGIRYLKRTERERERGRNIENKIIKRKRA